MEAFRGMIGESAIGNHSSVKHREVAPQTTVIKLPFTESRPGAPNAPTGYEPRALLTSFASLFCRAFTESSRRRSAALYVEIERHTRSTRSRITTRRAKRTARSSRNKQSRSVVTQEGGGGNREGSSTRTSTRTAHASCSPRASSTAARSISYQVTVVSQERPH